MRYLHHHSTMEYIAFKIMSVCIWSEHHMELETVMHLSIPLIFAFHPRYRGCIGQMEAPEDLMIRNRYLVIAASGGLNQQRTGFLQHKDPLQLMGCQKSSVQMMITSLLSQNLRHPSKKFIRELQSDLETVYVSQACLSWEFLHWQYEKSRELSESNPQDDCLMDRGEERSTSDHISSEMLTEIMEKSIRATNCCYGTPVRATRRITTSSLHFSSADSASASIT